MKDQATEESGANNFLGKYHYEINKKNSSNTCWTQLLVPLDILMSKIYLKYIWNIYKDVYVLTPRASKM